MLQARTCIGLLVLLALGACGGGGGATDPADPGSGAPASFDAGTAAGMLTLGFDGKSLADFTLTSTTGVRFVVPLGTSVRTLTGARVTGTVAVGLDDGGGGAAYPGGAGLLGIARLVALLGPLGAEAVTPLRFDPPARVEVDFGAFGTGGFALRTWMRGDRPVTGGPPGGPADGAGSTPLALGMADIADEQGHVHVPVRQTGVLGLGFEATVSAPPPPSPLRTGATTTVHEVELPGTAADTQPSVKAWKLINPDTAEIVAVFNVAHPGMTNGEGQIRQTGSNFFAANVITRDGKRYLQIRTNYSNTFVIAAILCDVDEPLRATSVAGSDTETDEDGTYVGAVELHVRGWGGFKDAIKARDVLISLFEPPSDVILRWFQKPGGGPEWFAQFEVHDYAQSVRTLGGQLPAGWNLTFRNRRIDIEIPCPAQRMAVTTFDAGLAAQGGVLHVADPTTLAVDASVPLMATPFDVVLDGNAENAYVASPDLLQIVDLQTPGVADLPLPGLTGAVGLAHTEDLVYAATSGGAFVAFDASAPAEAWRITTLPAQTYASMAVSPDGAFAYCASPAGQVVCVDLLRRRVDPPITIPAADSINLTSDGLVLAAVDRAGGGVRLVDLAARSVGALLPTGLQPAHALFSPDDRFLMIANSGSNSITLLDRSGTLLPQSLATEAGPNCLAVSLDPVLGPTGYVACFLQPSIQTFSIGPAAAVTGTLAAPPQPNVIRGNGQ